MIRNFKQLNKMETTCSMVGCYNTVDNDSEIHFYPFPRNFDFCMLWVQNCGRAELFEDFAYGGAQPFINRIICSDHFSTSDFIEASCLSKGLKLDAVPILNCDDPQLVVVKQEFEELDDSFSARIHEIRSTDKQIESFIKEESAETTAESVYSTTESVESVEDPLQNIDLKQDTSKLLEEQYMPLLIISNKKASKDDNAELSQKSQKAFQAAWKRALESAEQREARNRANALRNAFRRANETREQRKARNQANAVRNASRRANENDDQRKNRLYKNAVRAALRRSMESEDEQKERRRKNALRAACRRSAESEEQRAERRMKDKIRSAERRKRETNLQSKIRRYNDAVRAAFRRSNETEEQRQQRRMYDVIRAARRRSNENDEQRMRRLQADRERAAKRRSVNKYQGGATIPNAFYEHGLGSYLDYDISHGSSIKGEDVIGQCTNDSLDESCSNDDLSNHSYAYSECESVGNVNNVGEFSDNFYSADNGHSTFSEVEDCSSINSATVSNNINNFPTTRSSLEGAELNVMQEQAIDADATTEIVWCT